MVHTLRALGSSPELLLNTMDVFVKEPSVDWKVGAEGGEVEINNVKKSLALLLRVYLYYAIYFTSSPMQENKPRSKN